MNIDKNMEHSKLQRSTLYIKFKYPGEQEEVSKVVLLVQAYQQPIVCFFPNSPHAIRSVAYATRSHDFSLQVPMVG